jgi:hypothetical protein
VVCENIFVVNEVESACERERRGGVRERLRACIRWSVCVCVRAIERKRACMC